LLAVPTDVRRGDAVAENYPSGLSDPLSVRTLCGGPGMPEDCAEAALFLCEPASRFVTGVILNVDGGWCVSEGQLPTEASTFHS